MLPTFKVVIRKEKVSKITNLAPVCLRITKDRESTYKKIFSIKPEFFDERNQCVKKSCLNAEVLNARLSEITSEYKNEVLMLSTSRTTKGVSEIRNKINNHYFLDLFEYSENKQKKYYNEGNHSMYMKTKSVIAKLQSYIKQDKLKINSITIDFLYKYEDYLIKELKNNRNTITNNMKVLSKIVSDIYKEYDLDESANPFRKYKFKKEEPQRVFLEENEIKRIIDLKFTPLNSLFDAREIFIVECFSGIRISDILTLKWKHYDGESLDVKARKTKKRNRIPVSEKVKTIIEKRKRVLLLNGKPINPNDYIFNILKVDVETADAHDSYNEISSATAVINKKLKIIANKAKIKKNITTHVGRHSFATLLITKGATIYDVKELLGHQDVKITQIYTNLVDERKQKAINLINI